MPPTDPDAATLPPPPPGEATLTYVAPAADPPPAPDTGYDLLGEIARGGMGVVYKARQRGLDRVVALKMVLSGTFAPPAELRRFRAEAEAAGRLDHPNIVPVYDVGESEGRPFFTMAFIGGGSLAARLAAGPLAPHEAAEIVAQVADAVQYAHEQGIVHRDLKPANVLLDERGTPKVTDFGLAKRQQAGEGPTGSNAMLGTPEYMPPEQADGRAAFVGPAADIYSLGALLFALLTGRPPFRGPTPLETVLQVISTEPPRPTALRPGVPRDLETVCLKCLEKDPARRYATAKALADDLRRFLADEPIQARRAGLLRRGRTWLRKRPAVLVAAAAALFVGVSGLAYGLRAAIRDRDWQIAYLTLKAERLALPADPPAGDIDALAARLRALAARRPDQRLYGEAIGLVRAQGKAVRRVPAGPHEGDPNDPVVLPRQQGKKANFTPFRWDRDGGRIVALGYEFDATTGASTQLQLDGVTAKTDPPGQWLARFAPHDIHLRHRVTGRDRRIDLGPVTAADFDFTPGGHRLVLVTDGGPTGRRIELHDPAGERPPTYVTVPAAGSLRWAASGDGGRLAWCCDGDLTIYVVRVGDGGAVAAVSRPGAAQRLRGLAIDADGSRVAWSETGKFDRPPTVAVSDVATGRVAARLWMPDAHAHMSRLTFSPDGRWVFGTAFGSNLASQDAVFGEWLYKVLAWDAATGRLRLSVPGDCFAHGAGPNGELAVAYGTGPGDEATMRLDVWALDVAEAGVAALGLADNLDAEQAEATNALPLKRTAVRMPAAMAFAALGLVAAAAVLLRRPVARWVAAAALPCGTLAAAGGLGYLLTTFDQPGWAEWEAGVIAVFAVPAVAAGVAAVWGGVAALRSAGGPPAQRGRAYAWLVALVVGCGVAGPTCLVVACYDGDIRGAGVTGLVDLTLLAALAFAIVGGVVIGAAAAIGSRRVWQAVAITAGLWCAVSAARRIGQPPAWPVEIGRGVWIAADHPPMQAVGVALAAGLLAAAVVTLRRRGYVGVTRDLAQAATFADSGSSGGAA